METANKSKQVEDGNRLFDVIDRFPGDKRTLANIIAETFINGMAAQERLASAQRPGAWEPRNISFVRERRF